MSNLYMHTIDDKPAYYDPGSQIVFFGTPYQRVDYSNVFVSSLNDIKRQQRESLKWRKQAGSDDAPGVYGYIRIHDDRWRPSQ